MLWMEGRGRCLGEGAWVRVRVRVGARWRMFERIDVR